MINKYVLSMAEQMRIKLSKVVIVDGKQAGCLDVYLLKLSAEGHNVEALIFQSDLDCLEKRLQCDRLDKRVTMALERLQVMLEP